MKSVLERPLDNRNFRKKILGMGLLVELEETQKDVAHRAARLYRFDRELWGLVKEGFNFEVSWAMRRLKGLECSKAIRLMLAYCRALPWLFYWASCRRFAWRTGRVSRCLKIRLATRWACESFVMAGTGGRLQGSQRTILNCADARTVAGGVRQLRR